MTADPRSNASEGIPETTIFYDPATGCYGFSTRFPGRHLHHSIATFNSIEEALAWCDPHRESIWEEASDADETKLSYRATTRKARSRGAWRI